MAESPARAPDGSSPSCFDLQGACLAQIPASPWLMTQNSGWLWDVPGILPVPQQRCQNARVAAGAVSAVCLENHPWTAGLKAGNGKTLKS